MKIDVSKVIHNQADQPMTVSDTDLAQWTVGGALMTAVLIDTPDNGKTKLQRYELYLKLRAGDPKADYSMDDIKFLSTIALETYPTLFAGQIVHVLEQKTPLLEIVRSAE